MLRLQIKMFIISLLVFFSFVACSKEAGKKVEATQAKKALVTQMAVDKKEAPCDSKEDLLKKLEEKKKAEEEKGKGFSLQGGDTGCSVK